MRTVGFVLTAVVALIGAATAQAQVEPGDGILTVSFGYSLAHTAASNDEVTGTRIGLAYEKLDWSAPGSFGFAIGYSSVQGEDDVQPVSSRSRTSTESVPLYLGGKYWLGKSKIQGYLGVALGMYISWLEVTNAQTGEKISTDTTTGFGLGIPLGGTWSLGPTLLISANYTLNWLWDNEFFKDDLLHTVNLGLGFRLGK